MPTRITLSGGKEIDVRDDAITVLNALTESAEALVKFEPKHGNVPYYINPNHVTHMREVRAT